MLPPGPGSEPNGLANTQKTTNPSQNNTPVVSLAEFEQQSGYEVRVATSPAEAVHQREIERIRLQHELKLRTIAFCVAACIVLLTYAGAAHAALNGTDDLRKWGFGTMSVLFSIVTTFLYKSAKQ